MRLGLECVPVGLVVEVCDSTYFDHVSRGHDFRGLDYINNLTDYMERNGFVGCCWGECLLLVSRVCACL